MLLSMTGFGAAQKNNAQISVAVEVRSINNRYLKVNSKATNLPPEWESRVEKLVREFVSRGTISVNVQITRQIRDTAPAINQGVLGHYYAQLLEFQKQTGLSNAVNPISLTELLTLPGVVEENASRSLTPDSWQLIENTVVSALEKMQQFRVAEGQSMEAELIGYRVAMSAEVVRITELAPRVIKDYHTKIVERVRDLLAGSEAKLESGDVIREVGIFADRADISEELTRLNSHLEQFQNFLTASESMGRKLEFLGQEMFREVNTIGAKANNVEISHAVVELKAIIEKVREILQNVE